MAAKRKTLYEDERILCDDAGITIRAYYFPSGGSKHIPWGDIRAIEVHKMGPWTGKYRIWGGTLRYWLNLDWNRPSKDYLIILDLGGFVKPVITPNDHDAVVELIESRISAG